MLLGKFLISKEEIKGIFWVFWICVKGFEVSGIWFKYIEVIDINLVDVNYNSLVLVFGDDFGFVKLFRFFCFKRGVKFRKYVGYFVYVINVCWFYDF